jgi:RNA polymerase sigma factor (sigma-70 family)
MTFKTRDGETLDSVYESYREDLKNYFKRFGGGTEDLVQLVYLRLLRQRRLSEVRDTKAFIFWLASRVMASESPRLTEEARSTISVDPAELEELTAKRSRQSEDQGFREVEHADLKRKAEALRPEQWRVIKLHYFEELTVPEISFTTGLKPDTVRSHIKKALRTLRLSYGADALSKLVRQQQRKAP